MDNIIKGWCPSCNAIRQSLPAPAEGTCQYCYCHLMVENYPELIGKELLLESSGDMKHE